MVVIEGEDIDEAVDQARSYASYASYAAVAEMTWEVETFFSTSLQLAYININLTYKHPLTSFI